MSSRLITVIAILSALAWGWPQSKGNAQSQDQASGVRANRPAKVAGRRTINEHVEDYWSKEDAKYIITDPEQSAYKTLGNDAERDNFIEAFWARRDPTPDTIENEFKNEHYRRIVYANQFFSGHTVGWKTDRGRMYIMFGPPDSIEFTTLGAFSGRPEESQEPYSSVPVEVWHYKYLEGIASNVVLGFADKCGCDDPHLVSPPVDPESLNDQLADLSMNNPLRDLSTTPWWDLDETDQPTFRRMVRPTRSPQVRFKDLEEVVTAKIRYNLVPFQVVTTAVRATEFTDWVDVTLQLQKKDLTWKQVDGKLSTNLHLLARFTTLTGRVAEMVEAHIDEVADTHEAHSATGGVLQFSRGVPLRGGRYRLDIAVEDVAADKIGTWSTGLVVPNFYADEFSISPLILADQIDTPNTHLHPTSGELYIADTRIKPTVPASPGMSTVFHQGQPLGVFFQVYNLSQVKTPQASNAFVNYKLTDVNTGKTVVDLKDLTNTIGEVGEQITIKKFFSTTNIPKGEYTLSVSAGDRNPQRSALATARVRID